MRHLKFVLPALAIVYPAAAHALLVKMPIACKPGENCFIQSYVDHESGSGWKDYRCGHLSRNGNDGTDFALPTLVEMNAGVNVLAAAKGTVKTVRDTMKDIGTAHVDMAALKGYECGNEMLLEHEEGWTTRYCHLKKGSLLVKPGDVVKAGQVLGQVGLSGLTDYPHLHFVLRHDDKIIDPFTGKGPDSICGQSGFSQWKPPSLTKMEYKTPGVVAGGFTGETPTAEGIMEGKFKEMTVPADAGQLLFWVQVYGPREGDVIKLRLRTGEDGPVLADREIALDKSVGNTIVYVSAPRPESGYEAGMYTGALTLLRTMEDGPEEVVAYKTTVKVE